MPKPFKPGDKVYWSPTNRVEQPGAAEVIRQEGDMVKIVLARGGTAEEHHSRFKKLPKCGFLLARDLGLEELLAIVEILQEAMYRDDEEGDWDGDKEVNGGDLVEEMGELLKNFGMVPPGRD